MELLTGILSSTATANIIIIGTLIGIVGRLYLKLQSNVSLGMLSILGILLLTNIIGFVAYFLVNEFFSPEIFPYVLGINLAELVGLLIYLKISLD